MSPTGFDATNKSLGVTELLVVLLDDLPALARRTVATIRREVPAYDALPFDVHLTDNVANLRNLITELIRFAPPDQDAIDHARFMGRQRAFAHMRLETLTQGYHVAYACVWQELLALAEASDDDRVKVEISGYVTPLWHWFHTMSSELSLSYLEAESSLKATRSDMRAIVHEALRSDLFSDERSKRATKALDFEYSEPVTVLAGLAMGPEGASAVAKRFAELSQPVELIAVSPEIVVLSQSIDPEAVADILRTVGGVDGVGVGSEEPNFTTAANGLAEARRALACTSPTRSVAHFSDVWAIALVVENSALLVDLLQDGMTTAVANPHLAETVLAFTQNRFSLTATARAVQLHPNTAKYRLDRWRELTGWDVYTTSGLLNSLACLELSRPMHAELPERA